MKGLHRNLSAVAIALLMVGCGAENVVDSIANGATTGEAIKVTDSKAELNSSNAFNEMSMYKTAKQMKKSYPNAYALNKDFHFDIEKVSNFKVIQEHMKAKIEVLYINSFQDMEASVPKKSARALRIINGSKAKLNDVTWNFIVSLQADNQHFCGGSLIDKEWVLTAAHCVSNDEGEASKTLPSILTSTYSIKDGGQRFSSDAIYIHPLYASSGGNDGDIALVHLKTPIQNAKTVNIASKTPKEETLSKVAGWGNMSTTSLLETDDLMEVALPIINHDMCKNSYATENMNISDGMICAGYMDGSKDSCQGDSGGPLIVNEKGTNVLSGVVSFGGSQAQSCGAPNFPGVYTSVSSYSEWIKKQMSSTLVTAPVVTDVPSEDGKGDEYAYDINATDWENGDLNEEYENDFTLLESDLEPIFSEIDEAQTLSELKNILKNFLASLMQIFS